MTQKQRIEELEAKIKALELRLAMVEARPIYVPAQPYTPPVYPWQTTWANGLMSASPSYGTFNASI